MVIRRDIEQGTPEWFGVKLGIPSTSNFSRMIANGKGQNTMGLTAKTYAKELVIEKMTGVLTQLPKLYHIERGKELEPFAREWYEDNYFENVEEIGGIENQDCYCSTDGLIGEKKVLEIKCPLANTHFDYLIDPKLLIKTYHWQVQGELWLSERDTCILVSYHPDFQKQVVVEVKRDEKAILQLVKRAKDFKKEIIKLETKIKKIA